MRQQNLTNIESLITKDDQDLLLTCFPSGVISFDCEMTGLSPFFDQLIEISAVKITQEGIDIFSQLIHPSIPILNSKIHGIDDQMVKNALSVDQVIKNFLLFCTNLPMIAHNARFDIAFLAYNSFLNKIDYGSNEIYDSWLFSRFAFKNKTSKFGLKNLCEFLNLPLENHHRALDDSLAALLVFSKSLLQINQKEKYPNFKKHSLLYRFSDYQQPIEDLPKSLNLLEEKTPIQENLLLKYSGGSKSNQFREVKPISLLPLPTGNVLYALCIESDIYKNYLIKKITAVKEK